MQQTILIVEDQVAFRNSLVTLFSQQFLVSYAGNLKEADEKIQSETFDVLLTDFDLPDGKGKQLFEKIDLRKTIVYIMSGGLTPLEIIECFRLGAKDVFIKPFDINVVISAIKEAKLSVHYGENDSLVTPFGVISGETDQEVKAFKVFHSGKLKGFVSIWVRGDVSYTKQYLKGWVDGALNFISGIEWNRKLSMNHFQTIKSRDQPEFIAFLYDSQHSHLKLLSNRLFVISGVNAICQNDLWVSDVNFKKDIQPGSVYQQAVLAFENYRALHVWIPSQKAFLNTKLDFRSEIHMNMQADFICAWSSWARQDQEFVYFMKGLFCELYEKFSHCQESPLNLSIKLTKKFILLEFTLLALENKNSDIFFGMFEWAARCISKVRMTRDEEKRKWEFQWKLIG